MMGSLVLSQGMRAQCFLPERGRRRGDERLVVFAAPFLYAPFLTRECRINSDVSVDNTYQRDVRTYGHELLRNNIAIDTAIHFHTSPHSEGTPIENTAFVHIVFIRNAQTPQSFEVERGGKTE